MNNIGIKCGITEMIERIVEILTPNNCFICNIAGGLLCEACKYSEIEDSFRVCYSCSARSDQYHTCKNCRKKGVKPTALYHVSDFEGHAKKLIYMMKFSANREAAKTIASMMDDTIPLLDVDAVVPIPTATRRIRQRSYDHASLIAKELAKSRSWELEKLIKRKGQLRQLGSTKIQRIKQAEASFQIIKQTAYPKKVMLVDDVVSSGASIEAVTKLLRRAGVKEIYAAVFARKL